MINSIHPTPVLADPIPSPTPVNFHQVTSNLYRGGRPTSDELATLHDQHGIQTVIDLQGGDLRSPLRWINSITEPGEQQSAIDAEKVMAESLGMTFYNFPLDSNDRLNSEEDGWIRQILAMIKNTEQPIYVHCEHGKDRTGLIMALERVTQEGWSIADAKSEWYAFGHTRISRIFTHALDQYFNQFVNALAEIDESIESDPAEDKLP